MPKSDKALAARVKEFRIVREMTQRQAASLFRISMATFVRIEHGLGCSDLVRGKLEKILTQNQAAA